MENAIVSVIDGINALANQQGISIFRGESVGLEKPHAQKYLRGDLYRY